MSSTVIITMAGFGRRFLDAGYTVPKYRIDAHGRSLFQWSMLSLANFIRSGARFVFVVRAADNAADFIRQEAESLGITLMDLVELESPTDGQATTALLAGPAVGRPDDPMLIYNIDTFVHPESLRVQDIRGEGWIPCFKAAGDHWSFVAADDSGRASDVREKVRISPNATVGLYWFASFALYERIYKIYYSDAANLEKGERYVAPLYNQMLLEGRPVFITDVPFENVIPLGVPADVDAFRAKTPAAFAEFD